MKNKLFLFVVLLTIVTDSFGQQKTTWQNWDWLIGTWVGEGSGEPGNGGGTFSFTLDLDKKILVRKSHSEYSASKNKPSVVHEDLMIVYIDFSGNASRAIYFDNEGHTINYQISYFDTSIVLTSDRIPNTPIFRLTYNLIETETVDTKFEMSQDGENFITYIEGKSKKVTKPNR